MASELAKYTVKELLDAAIERAIVVRHSIQYGEGAPSQALGLGAREISLAITAMEEAQMWFTRGLAQHQGKFNPADLEKVSG